MFNRFMRVPQEDTAAQQIEYLEKLIAKTTDEHWRKVYKDKLQEWKERDRKQSSLEAP